jgi:hypothetical protein
MNRILLVPLCLILLVSNGCSIVKAVDAWKADNAPSLKTKNTLVIARTDNKKVRIAFEEAIANEMRKKGIQATESYKSIPELHPNKKLTEVEVEAAKEMLREASFNGVVITVLKDVKTLLHGEYQAAHYEGASYSSYFPLYYGDFFGYYNHPSSYVTDGIYVEESMDLQETRIYVLETLAFNLDEPKEKQLVASVVAKIEEPASVAEQAKPYASAIVKALKQAK